ncbi:MAG: Stk1 family PASTA domain-containing Ser/Thr kinase [Ruminococcus sp.]|uniref:Stk1 family PASTA domain-containing Ser/Thr kinase n=1 Tax=Ruminococcus sp. TaxID=41978 RepID=UPI0025D93E85|nr:Stk1 family PASTA domain-containing Ser/Thr kinase [Ruminococcus sp.]MBR5684443.1 Stk1 family PASTA domain-containing Ser/Thr kinase [Ruminococcus sp.]
MDKNIGKKLDGRYEITELIGVGGMAEVYKGVDVIDNKTVAIKILKKEYAENEEFLRRFRNESKAIAVLSHPNIVKIYDVGFSEKIQYIVMEYIDGITLKEYIEEEKVLTWKDTVHFVIQILRALQHAHDKGIVHRDIKPQNIMMFTDGTIKVMDFGIAKFAREEGKTATDQAIGSVHYISPEQASGSVTDAKSDIYSVGAMMYEMLTGKKPFDSDNPVAIAVMHMHDIPERPRAINPDIPDGLEEIVLRAMEKAPEDRYQTTAEMISDIEAFKANPAISFGYYAEEGDDTDDILDSNAGTEVQSESRHEVAEAYASKASSRAPAMAAALAGGASGGGYSSGGSVSKKYNDSYKASKYDDYDDYDDEDDEEEEEERSSLVVPVLTAVVVVVIIVAVIFIASMISHYLGGNGISSRNSKTMPNLIGKNYNVVAQEYGDVLRFEVSGSEYNEADVNTIIKQSIDPGDVFRKNDVCKVTLSLGTQTVEVPHVANINVDLAKSQLKDRGLEPKIVKTSDGEVKANYVIKSSPEEGEEVPKGSQVILYVSIGVNAEAMTMEDYVGLPLKDATVKAGYKKLKVKTEPEPSYEKKDQVIRQEPEKGAKIEAGDEIILYFSDGTIPDGKVDFSVNFPNEAYGRFTIDFVLSDGKKTTSESSGTILCPEMGNSYSTVIDGSGKNVTVKAYLTNISNNKRATLGSYTFDFANNKFTRDSEDVWNAFNSVDGFEPKETEPPTTEPTTTKAQEVTTPTTTEQQGSSGEDEKKPGENGIWNSDGTWTPYKAGVNGDWTGEGNSWRWY